MTNTTAVQNAFCDLTIYVSSQLTVDWAFSMKNRSESLDPDIWLIVNGRISSSRVQSSSRAFVFPSPFLFKAFMNALMPFAHTPKAVLQVLQRFNSSDICMPLVMLAIPICLLCDLSQNSQNSKSIGNWGIFRTEGIIVTCQLGCFTSAWLFAASSFDLWIFRVRSDLYFSR